MAIKEEKEELFLQNITDEDPPKRTGKTWFSKTIAWIHLWPSLISALILIFVCLTGTIIVYCDEIIDLANREVLHVAEVKEQKLSAAVLLQKFREAFPERRNPGYMVAYRDPSRTLKYNSYDRDKGLRLVYQDPYTGKILKDDGTIHFFYVTAHLHNSLLLHKPGEWIIDIATIIFLIELITGFILWWPAKWTKTTRKQSFKIKWKAKFKRLNYDLHNVLGFYALSISLVLTVTGLIIAFKPLADFTIRTFGGTSSHDWEEKLPAFSEQKASVDLNSILDHYFEKLPWAKAAQIATFGLDSAGHYEIGFSRYVGLKSRDGNYPVFVNRYTGTEASVPREAMLHEKVENWYWSLHMGTWMGWFGKLTTFIGGLIGTSLPVTGFYIWWNRRKKKKRPIPAEPEAIAGYAGGSFKPRVGRKGSTEAI